LKIAAVIARRGAVAQLSQRVRKSFAVIPPAGPHCVTNGSLTILGTGPGRWLFHAASCKFTISGL
jgi:hypothetical protein